MMSGIRSRDTRPEKVIRSALHQLGFRYRLHGTKVRDAGSRVAEIPRGSVRAWVFLAWAQLSVVPATGHPLRVLDGKNLAKPCARP